MQDITKYIEHTNVRPTATTVNIKKLCQEAKKYSFYAVCVSPIHVALAKKKLLKTNIAIVCVVGFPHGSSPTESKVIEVKKVVSHGADEVDMTMNIQAFKDKNYNYVHDDINAVVRAVQGKKVKVIIETGYLTHDEIKKAAQIVEEAGAHFVKTCTGFGPRGVRVGDVQLLSQTLKQIGIKASGGIDTYRKAVSMIKAGADRIGTSHGVKIMKELSNLKI
ncbi:deoxyribose-phosphate aldolase [Patescibacteria group bacterium AH-259-L07]|nr:deoxyribose-phosphate aldolase [Patescibacteria group bacterium AH-259-L07]